MPAIEASNITPRGTPMPMEAEVASWVMLQNRFVQILSVRLFTVSHALAIVLQFTCLKCTLGSRSVVPETRENLNRVSSDRTVPGVHPLRLTIVNAIGQASTAITGSH